MKKYIGMALLASSVVNAQNIEEIIVVGSDLSSITTDPSLDYTLIESINSDQPFTQGGYGGFAGFRERGAQTIHTTVYRNGMPVNDPSTGWFDFAHIIPTGQEKVSVSNGANSTIYGSGSLGGTVFLEDNLVDGIHLRAGTNSGLASYTKNNINITQFYGDNGSVMNTNTEKDSYKNSSIRYNTDHVALSFTDYAYDYDDCWGTDDCQQKGKTGNMTIRNDNFTLGYTFTNSNFYANGNNTYTSNANNVYFDWREQVDDLLVGVTYNNGVELYSAYNYGMIQLSTRVLNDHAVFRAGLDYDKLSIGLGTGYRLPTDYELQGDAWVIANPELDPEESVGLDVNFGAFSTFYYKFEDGIIYDWAKSQFVNSGEYYTKGVRYSNRYLSMGYTDSDQPYVSKYRAKLKYKQFSYTWNDLGVNTVDFNYTKENWYLAIQDIFNHTYEIMPNYQLGGRQINVGYSKAQ